MSYTIAEDLSFVKREERLTKEDGMGFTTGRSDHRMPTSDPGEAMW